MIPTFARLNSRIGRNAAVKLGSEVAGRAASLALLLLAARRLGASAFGLYNYGIALGFVVTQLADLGLQMLVAREVARQGKAAQPLVRAALQLKMLLSLGVVLLLGWLAAGYDGTVRLALFGLGLMMLAQTYLEFAAYVFRGQQRLVVEARLLTAARLAIAVTGGLVLLFGGGLLALALSSLLAVSVTVAWAFAQLYRAGWLAEGRAPVPYGPLLRQALPLGLAIFLSIAYTRLAVLLLQSRGGELLVAQFSAAHRLVEPGQILPASLLAAVFPAYAYALPADPTGARRLAWRAALLLAGIGLMVALGFLLLAPWLVPLLYGSAYGDAIPVLQLLGFSTIPAFVNYSLTHYLIAQGRQALLGYFMGAMLVLHAGLSWLLIPRLGAGGPAVSILVAEMLLLICCLGALRRTAPLVDHVKTPDAAESDPARAPATL